MPVGNAFRHQDYEGQPPRTPWELLHPTSESRGQPGDTDRCRQIGQQWADSGLAGIYLVHGTFTGHDSLGLVRELARYQPALAEVLRAEGKKWIDRHVGDAGNYSDAYVRAFQNLIGQKECVLPVRRFAWSGENHHTGRVEAAILLLDELLRVSVDGRRDFLLWGHSHAGNIFALLTNLVGSEPARLREFFAAVRGHGLATGHPARDDELLRRVERETLGQREGVARLKLALVTFGTPIRYGWETRGYSRLVHVVNHRPAAGLPAWRAPFPFTLDDLIVARHGDYVQQLGVAGTNFAPNLLSWRNWRVEQRLGRFLQARMRRRDILQRLKLGQRVPAEGETLLVDYPDDPQQMREQMLGHAIYTRCEWLPYHLQQIARRLAMPMNPPSNIANDQPDVGSGTVANRNGRSPCS